MVAVPEAIMGRKLTLEDYCALPDDQDYETIDGVLHVSPRPRPRHQQIAGELLFLLMLEQKRGAGSLSTGAVSPSGDRSDAGARLMLFFSGLGHVESWRR
jgi:hypothetical protein